MRESKAYQAAREQRKGKARAAAREGHGFRGYEPHVFAGDTCKACWIGDHLDAFTIRKIASRAFKACEQYAFGGRARPRFKRPGGLKLRGRQEQHLRIPMDR